MPGWHEATLADQQAGRITLAGIVEEQHPDRARLFMQWKRMRWPVLVDPLNVLGVKVVPVTVLLDEAGTVRAVNPSREAYRAFLQSEPVHHEPPERPSKPNFDALRRHAASKADSDGRSLADALVLWGGTSALDEAIAIYRRLLEREPQDAATHFRLGTAYRMRHDSPRAQTGDFERAVHRWSRALELDPNQYIWRRRLQQYGPRLEKPYPFYDWVHEARAAIRARGEVPVPLRVEPAGAEFAHPQKTFRAEGGGLQEPDPHGKTHRDPGLVRVETVVVPPRTRPGGAVRVHLLFRPDPAHHGHWNNEAGDMLVWLAPPPGWRADSRLHRIPRSTEPVSNELRRVEFEVAAPQDAAAGNVTLRGYALYYVCEGRSGTCLYRRRDLEIPVTVTR